MDLIHSTELHFRSVKTIIQNRMKVHFVEFLSDSDFFLLLLVWNTSKLKHVCDFLKQDLRPTRFFYLFKRFNKFYLCFFFLTRLSRYLKKGKKISASVISKQCIFNKKCISSFIVLLYMHLLLIYKYFLVNTLYLSLFMNKFAFKQDYFYLIRLQLLEQT